MFNKTKTTNKKAFTLIELLIVIAIIGILFIVLVSKVDFATDKAKATGVQTDFRSFQMAFDTVAKENAGFNTFGWDTGDANQNGKRDSYDEGDNGAGGGIANNGIQDGTEVFTGRKVYAETFTKIFSLKKNGTGSYDRDALNRLEAAINANLDPKLHITIKDDGEVVMANGAQDPWNKEYHGWYITNAETDKQDRGAIVMYSDGANNEFGSEHTIANGIVHISIPGSNKAGKDDYSIVSVYTYVNGYGEVKNVTSGFSNNQQYTGNNSYQNNTSNSSLILYNTRYIGKEDALDEHDMYFEFYENGMATYGEVNGSASISIEFEVITAYNFFAKEIESLSQSQKDDMASSYGLPDSYNDSDLLGVVLNGMSSLGIGQEDVLIIEVTNRNILFVVKSQTTLKNLFFGDTNTTFVANP